MPGSSFATPPRAGFVAGMAEHADLAGCARLAEFTHAAGDPTGWTLAP